jgi:hypothetical protein
VSFEFHVEKYMPIRARTLAPFISQRKANSAIFSKIDGELITHPWQKATPRGGHLDRYPHRNAFEAGIVFKLPDKPFVEQTPWTL